MDRLTREIENEYYEIESLVQPWERQKLLLRLWEYENTRLMPDEINELKAKLDKSVELPCKIGEYLYEIDFDCVEDDCESWCEASMFNAVGYCSSDKKERKCKLKVSSIIMTNLYCFARVIDNIGITVFKTREEAEQKLRELEGK